MKFYTLIASAVLSVLSFQASANGGISSESLTARGLSTEEKRGDFPVCFNGEGELLPCANGVDPPPPVDPYIGSWTGRLIYDRNSPSGETCFDANVFLVIASATSSYARIKSFTVIRDSGGLDTDASNDELYIETGSSSGSLYVFYSEIKTPIIFILQFNTQGSAHGYWNYDNGDCYGEWTFTKD